MLVHLGWRGQPQAGRNGALDLVEQLASRAEVADVGHAGADEDFIDLVASHLRQQASIVRVVWRAQDRLGHFSQIDFDDFGVLGIGISFH